MPGAAPVFKATRAGHVAYRGAGAYSLRIHFHNQGPSDLSHVIARDGLLSDLSFFTVEKTCLELVWWTSMIIGRLSSHLLGKERLPTHDGRNCWRDLSCLPPMRLYISEIYHRYRPCRQAVHAITTQTRDVRLIRLR